MVDDQWGEPVEIRPWHGADVSGEGEPDPNRPVILTDGILVQPGAAAYGEAGAQSTGMAARPVGLNTWLSISQHKLKGFRLADFEEGDRIYFPDRDEWYSVDHPLPSVTARPQLYLVRLEPGAP